MPVGMESIVCVFRHKLSLSDFAFSIQSDNIFFFSGKSSLWHLAEEMRLQ